MISKHLSTRDYFLIHYGMLKIISNDDVELECMRLQLLAMYWGYA